MALVGLHLEGVREHRSRYDPERATDEATVFLIGTLPSRIVGLLRDSATDFLQSGNSFIGRVKACETYERRVRYGLRGWRNFRDVAGHEIPFVTVKERVAGREFDVVSPECMDILTLDVIEELADEITKANTLGTEEGKVFVA